MIRLLLSLLVLLLSSLLLLLQSVNTRGQTHWALRQSLPLKGNTTKQILILAFSVPPWWMMMMGCRQPLSASTLNAYTWGHIVWLWQRTSQKSNNFCNKMKGSAERGLLPPLGEAPPIRLLSDTVPLPSSSLSLVGMVDEWWVVIGWRERGRDQRMQSHESLTGSTTPQHYAMQYSTTVNSSPQNCMKFWGFRFSLVASSREETEFRVCCWVVVWMSGTADSAFTSVWRQTISNLLAFRVSGSWRKAQVKDLFGVWVSHNTQLLWTSCRCFNWHLIKWKISAGY